MSSFVAISIITEIESLPVVVAVVVVVVVVLVAVVVVAADVVAVAVDGGCRLFVVAVVGCVVVVEVGVGGVGGSAATRPQSQARAGNASATVCRGRGGIQSVQKV